MKGFTNKSYVMMFVSFRDYVGDSVLVLLQAFQLKRIDAEKRELQ